MPFKRVAGSGKVLGLNTLELVWGRFCPKRLCRLTLPMPSKPHATFASEHRERVADGMNISYTIGCSPCRKRRTMLSGYLSWWRRFHLLQTAWAEYFFTAYPECSGYNHFKAINVITDAVWLFDISPRFNFVQFLMLVNGMNHLTYITREHPE